MTDHCGRALRAIAFPGRIVVSAELLWWRRCQTVRLSARTALGEPARCPGTPARMLAAAEDASILAPALPWENRGQLGFEWWASSAANSEEDYPGSGG